MVATSPMNLITVSKDLSPGLEPWCWPVEKKDGFGVILCRLPSSTIPAYINDLVIFTKTREEHLEHLRMVFARLQQGGKKSGQLSRAHATKLISCPLRKMFGLYSISELGYAAKFPDVKQYLKMDFQ